MLYLGRKVIRKTPGMAIKSVPLPKPEVTQGFGSRQQVGQICAEAGFHAVLVVTDKTIASLGLHEKVLASLRDHGIPHIVFSDIESEPTVAVVEAGRRVAIGCHVDGIVALGGGSTLDTAKIIAASTKHPRRPTGSYLQKFAIIKDRSLPMVTIPSTAGTGAECTVGAVVGNARGMKSPTVIVGLDIVHVILDSELIVDAPRSVTAWSAIDALSHGLEGLMADTRSTEEDVFKSRECVRLVLENLPVVLEDPHDIEARQTMLLAAHYGGNAINTQLAGYVHACAHAIGALYHIPHGKAIAWCLIPVLLVQEELCQDRLATLAIHCGLADEHDTPGAAADKLIAAIWRLIDLCGLPKGCDALQEGDVAHLVRMINIDSMNYSPPKTFSNAEVACLLELVREGC